MVQDRNNFSPRLAWPFVPSITTKQPCGGLRYVQFQRQGRRHDARELFRLGKREWPVCDDRVVHEHITAASPSLPSRRPSRQAGTSATSYTVRYVNPNLRDGYTQQWNASIEQALWNTSFQLSYIGMKSTNLNYRREIGRPEASTTPWSNSRYVYYGFTSVELIDQGLMTHTIRYNSSSIVVGTTVPGAWRLGVGFPDH